MTTISQKYVNLLKTCLKEKICCLSDGLIDYLINNLFNNGKNNVYIEQARLGGASNWKILIHYIIPNVLPSLLVNIFQDIGGELLTISGLSLLGLGSPPPTPEWGFMLSEGKDYMYSAPWMLIFPGLVILISVVLFNLLGDSIQDLMNPKESTW